MPKADTEAMNVHLAEISLTVAPDAHALVVLDGAGWHKSGSLELPDNVTLLKLPRYAPELNAAENIWQYLRANNLSNRVFDSYEDIVDACCDAWNDFVADPARVQSTTHRAWAQVNL